MQVVVQAINIIFMCRVQCLPCWEKSEERHWPCTPWFCACWSFVFCSLPPASSSPSTTVSATPMRPTWGPWASTPAAPSVVGGTRTSRRKIRKILNIGFWGFLCHASTVCFSVLVLIIFVLNVKFTNMAEETVRNFTQAIAVELKNKSAEMQLGYYLVIPYVVLSLLTIGVIYMYDHAAYTHRREQQKPTEDAPKEIMMY